MASTSDVRGRLSASAVAKLEAAAVAAAAEADDARAALAAKWQVSATMLSSAGEWRGKRTSRYVNRAPGSARFAGSGVERDC